jgi:hypothetical protein
LALHAAIAQADEAADVQLFHFLLTFLPLCLATSRGVTLGKVKQVRTDLYDLYDFDITFFLSTLLCG